MACSIVNSVCVGGANESGRDQGDGRDRQEFGPPDIRERQQQTTEALVEFL